VNVTTYKTLADEVEYLAKLIGVEHIGIGWLGHDKANPSNREVEGHCGPQKFRPAASWQSRNVA
jgi:hypothetical protein